MFWANDHDYPSQCFGAYSGKRYVPKGKSMGAIRKGVYPYPTYRAEFGDGTVIRMSFWSQAGKPWDFNLGRRLCEHWYHTSTGAAAEAIAGEVQQSGDIQAADPRFSDWAEEAPTRKRVTARQLKATLAAILELPSLPAERQHVEAERLVSEARELLAA